MAHYYPHKDILPIYQAKLFLVNNLIMKLDQAVTSPLLINKF